MEAGASLFTCQESLAIDYSKGLFTSEIHIPKRQITGEIEASTKPATSPVGVSKRLVTTRLYDSKAPFTNELETSTKLVGTETESSTSRATRQLEASEAVSIVSFIIPKHLSLVNLRLPQNSPPRFRLTKKRLLLRLMLNSMLPKWKSNIPGTRTWMTTTCTTSSPTRRNLTSTTSGATNLSRLHTS